MTKKIFSLLITLALTASMIVLPASAEKSIAPFDNGDRVMFLGDSITHYGKHLQYIEEAYASRYSQRNVEFINSGTSGDRLGNALERIESDIEMWMPTDIVVMYGMNDLEYASLYGENVEVTDAITTRRAKEVDSFKEEAAKLVDAIRAKDASINIIWLTPTPLDDDCTSNATNYPGFGDALEEASAWLKSYFASDKSVSVIDLNGPMTDINALYQAEDSSRSIIGTDRIHPSELGSYIMTQLILKAQGFDAVVAETTVDSVALTSTDKEISNIKKINNSISFSYTPESRPLYANSYYMSADKLTDINSYINKEILKVTKLTPGVYKVSVNGIAVGKFSDNSLENGIDISTNTSNGAYSSLETIHSVVAEKAALEVMLRNYAFCLREANKKGQTLEEYYNAQYTDSASSFTKTRLDDAINIYKNGDSEIKAAIDEKNAELSEVAKTLPTYIITIAKDSYTGDGRFIYGEDFERFDEGIISSLTGYTLRSNTGETYEIIENNSNKYFHMRKAATSSAKFPGLEGSFEAQTGKFIVEYDTMITGSKQSVVFRLLGDTASGSCSTPAVGITLQSNGNLVAFNNVAGSSSGTVKTKLTANTFYHIKVEVNVPDNQFRIWVDGTPCINPANNTYNWDFRQSSTLRRTNIYKFDFVTGNTTDGNVSGAVDNIFVYDTTNALETLLDVNFENTPAGTTPTDFNISASLNKNEFTAEYTDSTELNKAVKIQPNANTAYFMEYPIGARTDTLILDFDYKFDSTTSKPLGVYFDGNKSNAVSLFATPTKIYNRIEGGGSVYNQNIKTGMNTTDWEHMKVIVDINDQSITVWHNNEFLGITPFRYSPDITMLNKFKLGPTANTPTSAIWIDNIKLSGTGSNDAPVSTTPVDTYTFDGEIGTFPEGFSAKTGTATIAYADDNATSGEKVMKLESSETVDNEITFNFDSVDSGITNFEFDYKITQGTCPMTRFYLKKGNTMAISLALMSTQIYSMGDTNPLKTTIGTGEGWHKMILSVDVKNNSYTVTIDGTKINGTYKFRNKVTSLDNGYFGTAKHTGSTPTKLTTQIDNFVIGANSTNTGALSLTAAAPAMVNYATDKISGVNFESTVEQFLSTVSCLNATISVLDSDGNVKTSGNIETDDIVLVTGTRANTIRKYTFLPPYVIDVFRIDVGGDEYYEVDYIDKSGEAEILLNAVNNTNSSITPIIAAATYSGGKMTSVDFIKAETPIGANSYQRFEMKVTIPDLAEDGILKFYLWKNDGGIQPLIDSKQKAIKTDNIYSMPNIFCDGMVLQRNKDANIFGTAPTGTKITAEFDGQAAEGYASAGRFNIQLPVGEACSAGKKLTVTMSDDTEVKFSKTFADVVVGDVYFGSGQSNMQWNVNQTGNTITEIPENFRYFSVTTENNTNKRFVNPQGLVTSTAEKWLNIDSTNYKNVGALAFYTVLSMRNLGEIDVPIGFINCSRGSTRVGTWVGADLLLNNDEFSVYRSNYEAQSVDQNNVGETDLYYNMVRSVIPYTINAAVWYQGEADTEKNNYDTLMMYLIEYYRSCWNDDVPYFIMQLPGYGISKNWDKFRLLQWNIANITDKTYVVVNNDTGETDNIHPSDKDVVGERLARRILTELYGKELPNMGPVFGGAVVNGSDVVVSFDNVNDGLHGGLCSLASDGSLPSFEVSADGVVWYDATATISGNTVVITSADVNAPLYVRFGYVNTPVKSLGTDTNGIKLPLAPFSEQIG